MMDKYLSVLHYPHDDQQLKFVVDSLNEFIVYLSKEYKIKIRIRAKSTYDLNPALHSLLQRFLILFERKFKVIDISVVSDLLEIIKNPTNKMLKFISLFHRNNTALLEFFRTAKSEATSIKIEEMFLFISLKNMKLVNGQGPWGVTKGIYPFTVAIDATGDKEVRFHEFLHQLNVSDGYEEDDVNHKTKCSGSCWMQFVPTFGNSLCEKHSEELINFIKQVNVNESILL